MPLTPSAHVDSYARDNLPSESAWPVLEFTIPDLHYPQRLNAAEELLDGTIERYGADRIALRTPAGATWGVPEGEGQVWTYGELRDRVDQVARLLAEDYGIVPGNRVQIRIPNNPWSVILWLATLKVGGVALTTMVAWKRTELKKVADKARPNIVVVDHRYEDDVHGAVDPAVPIVVLGGPNDAVIATSGLKPKGFAAVQTAADDVAIFGPTSGTTGIPKITTHFHRDVLANADTFAKHILRLGPDDVSAGSPPLAFTFGLGGLVVFPFRFGGSSLLIEKASPAALAEAIEPYGITVLYTAPSGYRTMLKAGSADALRKLRVGVSAGEHLPKETYHAVQQATGLRLVNGLGSTELLHVFISAAGEDIRPGATGKAVPGFRATVLDDEGAELAPGQAGRLAVIGPTGARYLDDPRQANYVQHGWNITGDTYTRDEEGYFFYQARTDDIIVAAGYNIAAPEVEAVIDQHPCVIESAVVGRPDPEKGAIVNAFVVLRPGVPDDDATRASILDAVRAQLASYKLPRRIDFIDVLPRNASNKLQRFPLRQRAEREAAEATANPTTG